MKKPENRYTVRSRFSEAKIRESVLCFAVDLTGLQTANLSDTNHNTINHIYLGVRQRIFRACEEAGPLFGFAQVDESLFGLSRMRGKRGLSAYGKTTDFGIFERDGQVYTEIVPGCSKAILQGIIDGRMDVATIISNAGWRGYKGLVDLGYGYFRVDHSKNDFAGGRVHINGIYEFRGLATIRLAKFRGLPKHTVHLHLKETKWRQNNRTSNKTKLLLEYLQ
jgi:transposase